MTTFCAESHRISESASRLYLWRVLQRIERLCVADSHSRPILCRNWLLIRLPTYGIGSRQWWWKWWWMNIYEKNYISNIAFQVDDLVADKSWVSFALRWCFCNPVPEFNVIRRICPSRRMVGQEWFPECCCRTPVEVRLSFGSCGIPAHLSHAGTHPHHWADSCTALHIPSSNVASAYPPFCWPIRLPAYRLNDCRHHFFAQLSHQPTGYWTLCHSDSHLTRLLKGIWYFMTFNIASQTRPAPTTWPHL